MISRPQQIKPTDLEACNCLWKGEEEEEEENTRSNTNSKELNGKQLVKLW